MNIVKIKLLNKLAKIPLKAHATDACYDVYATSMRYISKNIIEYGLGFALEIPENSQVDIRPRSSIYKTGLVLSNSIGTGDEGYTGEYKMIFYHVVKTLDPYQVGDRIGQMQIRFRTDIDLWEGVLELNQTERGDGGHGSTGKS